MYFCMFEKLGNYTSVFKTGAQIKWLYPVYAFESIQISCSALSKAGWARATAGTLKAVPRLKPKVESIVRKLGKAGKIVTGPEIGAFAGIMGGVGGLIAFGASPYILGAGAVAVTLGGVQQSSRERAKEDLERQFELVDNLYRHEVGTAAVNIGTINRGSEKFQSLIKKANIAAYPAPMEYVKSMIELSTQFCLGGFGFYSCVGGKAFFMKTRYDAPALMRRVEEVHAKKIAIARNRGISLGSFEKRLKRRAELPSRGPARS